MAAVLRSTSVAEISVLMSHLFQVIPEPRCLNNVKAGLEKGRYKEATDVYTDISLVFWNALYYNEPGSGIATDAETLKVTFLLVFRNRNFDAVQ